MAQLYEIASKAQYIHDIALDLSDQDIGIVEDALLDGVLRQLCNIAETLDEYHDW